MPFLVLTAVLAALLLVMTWSAAAGRLPANGIVGLRTPALLRSEEGWRAGHRAALVVLAPVCPVVLGACVVAAAVRPWGRGTADLVGGVLLVVLLVAALVATLVAHRRARSVVAHREPDA